MDDDDDVHEWAGYAHRILNCKTVQISFCRRQIYTYTIQCVYNLALFFSHFQLHFNKIFYGEFTFHDENRIVQTESIQRCVLYWFCCSLCTFKWMNFSLFTRIKYLAGCSVWVCCACMWVMFVNCWLIRFFLLLFCLTQFISPENTSKTHKLPTASDDFRIAGGRNEK